MDLILTTQVKINIQNINKIEWLMSKKKMN